MSPHHVIRLREPWERQRLDDGSLRLTRRFHRPTGLDAGSRVWLVIEGVDGKADVSVNDQLLARVAQDRAAEDTVGTAHRTRFEITDLLQPESVVSILLRTLPESDPQADGFRSVRLEIEESDAQN